MRTVRVRVPATTANLGPGFDSLGLALTLWNDVTLSVEGLASHPQIGVPRLDVELHGEGADELPADASNLVWQGVLRALHDAGMRVSRAHLVCHNRVPLCSGLGSSAAACVAGLMAGNALSGDRIAFAEIVRIAAAIEGHADNAAAALWGGLTACYDTADGPAVVRVPLRVRFQVVVCTPELKLATEKSRSVLPKRILYRDAVVSVGRTAALTAMLAGADLDGLAAAMEDVLHQPHRVPLVPGMEAALRAAREAGALGAALSGAGPTVTALVPPRDRPTAERVARELEAVFRKRDLPSRSRILRVDRQGARVLGME